MGPSWTSKVVLFAVACLIAADTAHEGVAATLLAASHERSGVILDRNSSDDTPAPAPVQRDVIETSRLPVTLIGTFAANDASLSRATLHDRESQQTLVVAVGDEIEDQALVVRIEPRRVVLLENGAPRDLILAGAAQDASPVHGNRFLPGGSEQTIFDQLLGQGRVLPKFEDGGQMVGLEVSAIQAGSRFEEIGLENGDVITEFNGAPVDSQAQIAPILQKMSDADDYHIAGRRADGSEQVWDFVR